MFAGHVAAILGEEKKRRGRPPKVTQSAPISLQSSPITMENSTQTDVLSGPSLSPESIALPKDTTELIVDNVPPSIDPTASLGEETETVVHPKKILNREEARNLLQEKLQKLVTDENAAKQNPDKSTGEFAYVLVLTHIQ